jgi:membrane protease YdiL (CAAX protease family)
MDIAAGSPDGRPDAPIMHGQRIDWTPRDVLFGVFWFIFLFVLAPIPLYLPFALGFGSDSTETFVASLAISMLSEVGLVVVASYYTFRRYGGSWDRLGIRVPTWSTLWWGIGALAAAFVVSLIYGLIIQWFDIDALMSECDDQIPREVLDDRFAMVIATILIVSFAPVCEELFFRGFVFPGLAKWGFAVAILASALLFSVAHVGPSLHKTFIPILAIGIIFAFAYWRSGNILTTILAHLAFNSLSVIALWNCDPSS